MLALPPPAAHARLPSDCWCWRSCPCCRARGDARQDAAGRSPRNASYTAPGDARSGGADDHRHRPPDLAQHLAPAGHRTALPPLLERLARRELDLDARAGARRRHEPGRAARRGPRLRSTCRRSPIAAAKICCRARSSSRLTTATPTTGRCSRCRSTACRAGRDDRDRSRLDRAACRGRSRAPARIGRLLLHRAVVSEDRRARRRPAGTATSSTRRPSSSPTSASYDVSLTVPPGWIVGATGREQSKTDLGNGTTTHRYLQADVHDFAWTTSPDFVERRERFEEAGPAAGRDAAAAAARARRPGRSALRGDARRAEVLRHLVRSISVRTDHDRRSGDDLQSRTRRARAPAAWSTRRSSPPARAGSAPWTWLAAGERDGPRGRPSVLVRHRRHQRVRARVDGRRAQHVRRRRACSRKRFRHASSPWSGTSAASCPGRIADVPMVARDRRQSAERVSASRQLRRASRRRPGSTGRDRPARSRTTRRRSGWRRSSGMLGWPTVQKILATYFARGAFRHPTPDEFFAIASEVSGQDLTWFFDAVHRSSATFDYGVAQVSSTARRLDRRRAAVRRRRVSRHHARDVRRRIHRRARRGTAASAGARSGSRSRRRVRERRSRSRIASCCSM